MKRRMFGILAALSLLLFAAVVWAWVRSFDEDRAPLTWKWSGDRYAVRSHWGRVLLVGPPGAGVGVDAELESLAARVSNQDLAWTSLGHDYVQGEVHSGTPTWEMDERVERATDDSSVAAAMRVCLRGLDDPRRFAACHVILLLEAEDRWRARWVDEAKQPWREASAAGDRLILFIAADQTGAGPDASRTRELRDRWDAVLYEPRATIFYGWIALGALALPLAWAARPRREPRTRGRWVIKAMTIISVLLLAGSVVMWVRSYGTGEQWMFAPRRGAPLAGMHAPMRVQRWIGSVEGRLVLCEREDPETSYLGSSMVPWSVGYSRTVHPIFRAQVLGATPKDERHWKIAGIEYCGMPAQELVGPPMPMPGVVGGGFARTQAFYGFRFLILPWWTLVVLGSLLPMLWVFGYINWRLRKRRARRLQDKICLNCGYDLRASTERCPECGEAIAAAVPAVG